MIWREEGFESPTQQLVVQIPIIFTVSQKQDTNVCVRPKSLLTHVAGMRIEPCQLSRSLQPQLAEIIAARLRVRAREEQCRHYGTPF